jgi:predicted MFS family arabinose efflux permease
MTIYLRRLYHRVLSPTPVPPAPQDFRHLYADIFWYGLLAGSAVAFLSIYAARIGATSFQIGLLSAGPAIVNLMFSLPAGRWLEGRSTIRLTFLSSIWHRAAYVAFVFLPVLLPATAQAWVLPLVVVLMSVPGTLLAIGFNAMFADVVPPEARAMVVGRRSMLFAVSATLTALLAGLVLDNVVFPLNYQIVFLAGVVGAALSSYHLGRIRGRGQPPPRVGQPIGDAARPGSLRATDAPRAGVGLRFLTRSQGKPLLRLDLLRGPFGLFLLSYLAFYVAQNVPIPLFPLFWVNTLHLPDGAISLNSALFNVTLLLGSSFLARISARLGHHRVQFVGALLYGTYPLLNGLAQSVALVSVASILGGAIWALTSGGMVNRLMERVPEDDRPAHMALQNLVLNLGVLIGALLGPAMSNWIGLRETLIVAGLLRGAAALLLRRWG